MHSECATMPSDACWSCWWALENHPFVTAICRSLMPPWRIVTRSASDAQLSASMQLCTVSVAAPPAQTEWQCLLHRPSSLAVSRDEQARWYCWPPWCPGLAYAGGRDCIARRHHWLTEEQVNHAHRWRCHLPAWDLGLHRWITLSHLAIYLHADEICIPYNICGKKGYMLPIFGNQLLWRYFSVLGPITQMGKNGSLALAGAALGGASDFFKYPSLWPDDPIWLQRIPQSVYSY